MSIFGFLIRTMFRHKLSVTLTISALAIAFILLVFLRSVAVVFEEGVEISGATRLQSTAKYSMIQLLPYSHGNDIAAVEGVSKVTHASWFGGVFREGDTQVATFAVDHETYFEVYEIYSIDPDQLQAFKDTRTAALAPQSMIDRYDWEIGQKISCISPIFPNPSGEPWSFELVGTYQTEEGGADSWLSFLFHYDYLNETMDLGAVGWYTFSIDDPERSGEIAIEIDKKFENTANATKTMTESEYMLQFLSQYGDISLMTTGILVAMFFTMILLALNTMLYSYRKRVSEIGALKTMGFSDGKLTFFVICEGLMVCGIGALIGLSIGSLGVSIVDADNTGVFTSFKIDTVLLGAAIAVILGLLVSVIPAISAHRLTIVAALRAH